MPTPKNQPIGNIEIDSYSVDAFCAANPGLSTSALYLMWQEGTGPDYFLVGQRRRISKEAAARWREAREAAAREPAAVDAVIARSARHRKQAVAAE